MQLTDKQRKSIAEWVAGIDAVEALWLFGTRARDEAGPESDYDFAMELRPPEDGRDWAHREFVTKEAIWKATLRGLVGGNNVDLVPWRRGSLEGSVDPREKLVWRRSRRKKTVSTSGALPHRQRD